MEEVRAAPKSCSDCPKAGYMENTWAIILNTVLLLTIRNTFLFVTSINLPPNLGVIPAWPKGNSSYQKLSDKLAAVQRRQNLNSKLLNPWFVFFPLPHSCLNGLESSPFSRKAGGGGADIQSRWWRGSAPICVGYQSWWPFTNEDEAKFIVRLQVSGDVSMTLPKKL